MKSIGITGAAGYIGSRVCHELMGAYDIVPVDNFFKGTIREIVGKEVVKADIRDKKALEKILDVDCVVHLAAIPGVEPCNILKELSYDVNVNGTRVVAAICKEQSIPLIFATSFGTIGNPQYFPIDETHPRNPIHWYGQTKYHGERIVTEASHDRFPCYLIMKSNVYGVHVINGNAVSKPTVVNRFVDTVREGEKIFLYKPGSQARNFLHVTDAATSYRLAVSHILKAKPGAEPFCIATAEALSIAELARKVQTIAEEYGFHPEIEMRDNPRKETLVEDFSINISKAQRVLGFAPQYTIERAVQEMFEKSSAGKGSV
ncbi:MAG: NAD(P)-dependent oxidoreductase [Theionarchaea archaeon]|nr:NAD(P)-dependent oxidoreductase [Theionarchaea archaeon]MBU7038891.1 NAD(P)-dependent oxidoreductase [Theionarchaea archaeon]